MEPLRSIVDALTLSLLKFAPSIENVIRDVQEMV